MTCLLGMLAREGGAGAGTPHSPELSSTTVILRPPGIEREWHFSCHFRSSFAASVRPTGYAEPGRISRSPRMRWFLPALLILFAALLLESGLLAYSMYVLLGLLLLARFLARSCVENLTAERVVRKAGQRDDEEADSPDGLALEVGDRVAVRLTLHNDGALPITWLLVEDVLPGKALDPVSPKLKVKGKRIQVAMLGAKG